MPISEVLNCDCNVFMKTIPDKFFDLAIVDPEYGIDISNRTSSIGQKKGQGKITKYLRKSWDNKPAGQYYFNELFRVSVNQIIWGANYFAPYLPTSKTWVIWDKGQPEGVTFAMGELAFTSFNDQTKIFRKSFASNCNKVANNNSLAKQYVKIHPTQKPVALYKWLLKNYAKPGDKIFDSHGGSMSSVIACIEMGFEITCCELDEDYYNLAKLRINNNLSQLNAFREPHEVRFHDNKRVSQL